MAIQSPYFTTFFPFRNQTTNAISDSFAVILTDRKLVVKAGGTWDGASIVAQNLMPQSSPEIWIDIPNKQGAAFAFTANSQETLNDLVSNEQIRFVLTNAGAATDVTISCEFI